MGGVVSTTMGQVTGRSGEGPTAGPDTARGEVATALPAPRAARLRRPGWRDPRLLLGLALVGLSVLLGSWAVATAARTVPVLAATEALVPGDPVRAEALRVVDVRVPDEATAYLTAGTELEGLVVTRVVGAGELVPASAVATEGETGARAVAVTTEGRLSGDVVEGSLVDLWFVPDPDAADDEPPPPRELAGSLVVAEVDEGGSAFSVGSGVTVHVLVPVPDLAAVLSAVRGPGTVEVVPVPGGAP